MKKIVAHHYMSNFENKESLIAWLSKYHVYTPYAKHIELCWNGMQAHVGKSDEHKKDYFIEIYKNLAGKFCLSVKRKIRPTLLALDGGQSPKK